MRIRAQEERCRRQQEAIQRLNRMGKGVKTEREEIDIIEEGSKIKRENINIRKGRAWPR